VHLTAAVKGKVANVEAVAAKMEKTAVKSHENKQNMLNTAPLVQTPKVVKHRRSGSF
jgi:hypothetical protein